MPITAADIQLLESERMRDTPDGGGRQTGNVIPSGEAGNVFPKVSRVDSVYGRVNLRKIYVAVRTATLDMYAGAHAIITDPPDNERISCCLFSTGSSFDTRTQARDRIESYVVAGPFSRMRLYGNQLIGQKAILVYQREEEPLPDVGDVLVLSVEASGYAAAQQYVRITDVTHEVRVFTDGSGDYSRRVLTLKIGAPLNQTFIGAEPSRYSADTSPTKLRVTQVADASRYFGVQPLVENAEVGALTLRMASVYAPLVPSTARETAVSQAQIAAAAASIDSGTVTWNVDKEMYIGAGDVVSLRLPRLPQPGSILASAQGDSGVFRDVEGVFETGGISGAVVPLDVNYETGDIRFKNQYSSGFISGLSVAVTFSVAGMVSAAPHTRQIPITLGSRGTVYAETLTPLPAPGTLIVDFRALGRWYRLRDNGAGQLVANAASEGTGSVDYVTGAVVLTLGALPDVDSAVLFAWGSPAHYAVRAGSTADASTALRLDYTLAHAPVVPGTLALSYPVGGASRTAADAAADGNLTGTGVSGTINYATGAVRLEFSTPPDRAANITNVYTWRDGADLLSGTTATISGGQFIVPGTAPFRNGGSMTFTLSGASAQLSAGAYITDDGQVRVFAAGDRSGSSQSEYAWADQPVGTFDAGTGVVTIIGPVGATRREYTAGEVVSSWGLANLSLSIAGVSGIAVERDTAAYDPRAVNDETIAPGTVGLMLDLSTTIADAVVAGSVMFRATGKTYVDRNGTLYSDLDPLTGSGTPAGSIDYETGRCTLTWWADNTPLARTIEACLTQYGDWTATEVFFRTAGSPIRPASLYVQVSATDGQLLTGTADQNGVITGSKMRGTVEQTMGVVAVEFGETIDGIWMPREVQPGTLRYNCVVLTNLPLEANILGLDPVRLPADGRVPIYRPGDVVVIHNTQHTALPNPVVAGATYNVGRTDLAVLRLEDADGEEIAADRYVAGLSAGTVTIAADWSRAGVAQPLVAAHRVEDMNLLADVQINGQIDLSAPTVHAYPAEGTYVSSALLFGDLQAIVTNLFDQQTWSGAWSDGLIGSQANSQYDDINYPVEVLNRSAITERWRISFTSTTAFAVIGENLGQIATGSTSADCSPINPVTGEAYFVLRAAGWGGGWAAGNQLRFNTVGANGPTWIARTILAGATLEGDSFDLEARGDVD